MHVFQHTICKRRYDTQEIGYGKGIGIKRSIRIMVMERTLYQTQVKHIWIRLEILQSPRVVPPNETMKIDHLMVLTCFQR